MALSIHNWLVRLIVSTLVFFAVAGLIVPHLMDVDPPLIVDVLLTPADLMAVPVGKLVPLHNIGTPENPFYEATPVHLLTGLALASVCILLYPLATYVGLSLLSRIVRKKRVKSHA